MMHDIIPYLTEEDLTMVRSLRGGGLCLDPTSVVGKVLRMNNCVHTTWIQQNSDVLKSNHYL